jgi:hypothetical protein
LPYVLGYYKKPYVLLVLYYLHMVATMLLELCFPEEDED